MWESPIKTFETEIKMQLEGETLRAVQNVDVHVNKDELLRALAYDRDQYNKGYSDGVHDVCRRIVERLGEVLSMRNVSITSEWLHGVEVGLSKAIEIVKEEM